jgi:hypothetical protein
VQRPARNLATEVPIEQMQVHVREQRRDDAALMRALPGPVWTPPYRSSMTQASRHRFTSASMAPSTTRSATIIIRRSFGIVSK